MFRCITARVRDPKILIFCADPMALVTDSPGIPYLGCCGGTMRMICHGGQLVIPSPTFEAKLALNAIESKKVTSMVGVPTMYLGNVKIQQLPVIWAHRKSSVAVSKSIKA